MNPIEIRYRLRLNETTQTDVARQCSVSQPSVWQVIEGLSRSAQIEKRIAFITNQPLEVLWPQWYGPNAKRRRRHTGGGRNQKRIKANLPSLEQSNHPATNGA